MLFVVKYLLTNEKVCLISDLTQSDMMSLKLRPETSERITLHIPPEESNSLQSLSTFSCASK